MGTTKNSAGAVWVIVDQTGGQPESVSMQLIGHARKLADQLGASAEAVFLGNKTEQHTGKLIAAGADKVYLADAVELALFQPESYTEMIVQLAGEQHPEIILLGSTFMGRELAPLVAARLETGLTAHCIDLVFDDDQVLEQRIPAYGGMISITCPERRPQMATVAKGVFPAPDLNEERVGEIVRLELPKDVPGRVETLEVVIEESEGVELESAPIIVAAGVGVGDKAGWDEVADLATTMNAGLAATRPAVDEGWVDISQMVGQSGKMVSPELYIGIGLSGELQHMVGITGAKLMVAINNDARSPVFEQVDVGIVDDCREFVPVLLEKIKDYQEKRAAS
jgi:electron transfer flavoprotein alpha subunit